MKKIPDVFHIDAFTSAAFEGNPAAVLTADSIQSIEMQKIAAELNLSETAFIQKSKSADYFLRWFTPVMEVDLCVHATIASLHYLNEMNLIENDSEILFETKSGILKCCSKADEYFVQMPVPQLKIYDHFKTEILNALNISGKKRFENQPFVISSNGNLFIHSQNFAELKNLKPDFNQLFNLTKNNTEIKEVSVYTTETVDSNSTAHLRHFAPYYGINEDPVTGSAIGPLLMVLRFLGIIKNSDDKLFTFEQGDIIGRRGRAKVIYSPVNNLLQISGNAITILKGDLYF